MQITFKRNGIKNYMIVKNERNETPCLREKMIVRNNIPYLAKMTPQSIDGHSYFYYDIQGRVSLETVFSGKSMTQAEVSVILHGLSGLLAELERYLLTPSEVLFAPSDIWLLPDTLEPSFIYVPDSVPDESHSIHSLAEFLTEHVDGNDREAATMAYGYLEMVESGCIIPDIGCPEYHPVKIPEHDISLPPDKSLTPPIDPDEYWDIKEGIADDMKPFFEDDLPERKNRNKKIAYILLGLVMALAASYIILILNPAFFPIILTDEEYIVVGSVIAVIFAAVLIIVMCMCGKKDVRSKECPYPETDVNPAVSNKTGDDIDYLEYQNNQTKEGDEKTVLIHRPASMSHRVTVPVLRYEDGRDILLSTFPFIVGKMKTRVDGIVDGAGVSRIHAMIKEKDGRYYLSDLNSMNGTGINGKLLDTNDTAEIKDGDIISFAGTSLTFHTKAG